MVEEGKIWVASDDAGRHITLDPALANRHGLIAGATGTGKTVTLKVLAEGFSSIGTPVFVADVKGDIAGLVNPGTETDDMKERINRFGLSENGYVMNGFPVTIWDCFGEKGIPLRTTVSEMGPVLLSRLLGLNDLQTDILSVAFKIADEQNLLLVDIKDLKALLNYISEHNKEFEADYGKMSPQSIAAIVRALVALSVAGGDTFFGEPALSLTDWFTQTDGKGMIHVLDASKLMNDGKLYSTFLLWMMSELFETLPEVGDQAKPKLVFFFDEAHLLFADAPKAFLDKVEQVVKLIRSKGVGIYFCTQNPKDIPNGILSQLGNKIQHGLRAYTPADQKAVKAAADSYRANPDFDTADTIMNLGTGEAVISFLEEGGVPMMAAKGYVLPPQSSFGAIDEAKRNSVITGSILYSKYANPIDPDSAFEFLERRGLEEAAAAEAAAAEAEAAKQAEKEAKEAEKAAAKAAAAEERRKKQAINSVGNSVAGTVGREAGKNLGKTFGKFGKTLGGNVGASLGRGLFATLFRR